MDVLIVSLFSFIINIFLGKKRVKYRKFTFTWWLIIHASIPLIIPLRIWLQIPNAFIPLFIGLAIFGQYIGSKYLIQ